jgi:hypothetical protein
MGLLIERVQDFLCVTLGSGGALHQEPGVDVQGSHGTPQISEAAQADALRGCSKGMAVPITKLLTPRR